MWCPKPDHPLRRLFAGLAEQTFITAVGTHRELMASCLPYQRLHEAQFRRLCA